MIGESIKNKIATHEARSQYWALVNANNSRDAMFKIRYSTKPIVEQLVFTDLMKRIREF